MKIIISLDGEKEEIINIEEGKNIISIEEEKELYKKIKKILYNRRLIEWEKERIKKEMEKTEEEKREEEKYREQRNKKVKCDKIEGMFCISWLNSIFYRYKEEIEKITTNESLRALLFSKFKKNAEELLSIEIRNKIKGEKNIFDLELEEVREILEECLKDTMKSFIDIKPASVKLFIHQCYKNTLRTWEGGEEEGIPFMMKKLKAYL